MHKEEQQIGSKCGDENRGNRCKNHFSYTYNKIHVADATMATSLWTLIKIIFRKLSNIGIQNDISYVHVHV